MADLDYGVKNIKTLGAGQAYRERIGMYLSGDKQEAINLGLRELVVNVQDEYQVYKPKNPKCSINIDTSTHVIIVSDNMRGIPVGIREDGTNSLTATFLIPHSGGKMDSEAYKSAVGLNGQGNKVVCHTAQVLEVEVRRDGKIYTQKFESDDMGAHPITDVIESNAPYKESGTIITYIPDKRVYGDVFIDVPSLKEMLKEMSWFAKGLHIELCVDGEITVFESKNGLLDGLKTDNALSKPFSYYYKTDDCEVELALQWVSKGGQIRGYANGLYMPDGGKFITAFKTSLTRTVNSLAKKKKKFTGDEIRKVLSGFVSVKVEEGQFSNQAKTALANAEAATATSTATSEALKDYVSKHPSDFNNVLDLLDRERRAEEAAEKAREKVRNHIEEMTKASKAKILNPDKLRDARKLGQDSILLVNEGLSAGGSMSIGRDPMKYGILMLRGKVKNLLKCSIEEGLDNEEVKLFCQALGLIYGKPYNINKFRYGKIAIAVDADADGSHIGLLVMALCEVLCPEMIEQNRLYWLKAPLYKVTKGKKDYYFYSDEELQNSGITGDIIRYKGLGQMSEDDLKNSMFSEEFQHLEPIVYEKKGIDLLIQLMSDDPKPKRDFIFNEVDFSTIGFE